MRPVGRTFVNRIASFVIHWILSHCDREKMGESDKSTTVAELRQLIADFVAERDWSQFHSPKNVSMALAIEAAELMEHFQWLTTEDSRRLADEPAKLAEVGEE